MLSLLLALVLILSLTTCSQSGEVRVYSYKVEEALPHDISSYTQGLFFYEGQMYESAGQYGESSFRQVDPKTGKVLKRMDFDGRYFAEGSCVLNGKLYILTWQEKECFVYDIDTWKRTGSFDYEGEGWGLTTDGKSLIMSDGSSKIVFRNPETFLPEREVTVKMNGKNIVRINELEYIKGEIWANIYCTDMIIRIDPETGEVKSMINCKGLLPKNQYSPRTDVLNGIAYNERTDELFFTGKCWPTLFKVKIVNK